MEFSDIEKRCYQHMKNLCIENPDPSHDILHVNRVVAVARKLAQKENAELEVVTISFYSQISFNENFKISVFFLQFISGEVRHDSISRWYRSTSALFESIATAV